MIGPVFVGVLFVALAVGYVVTQQRVGFWKARSIGVVVVAVLLIAYFGVLAIGQLI